MRIAVYHNLPSGGAKRTLYEALKRLHKRHKLDVFSLDTADRRFCDLSEWTHSDHVYHFSPSKLFQTPLGRLNQIQRWRDLYRLDKLSRQISREIDTGNYDLVFVQPCMWTQAPLVLRYLQTPTTYYCHEPPRHIYDDSFRINDDHKGWQHKLDSIDPFIHLYRSTVRRFDREAVYAAGLVLVNSNFIQERVKQIYGIDSAVSYHGVDTDTFSPRFHDTRKGYVLSVGAIQPHKGYDFLIESLGSLPEKTRPKLLLVGNTENTGEQMHLQNLALHHDVELSIEVGVTQDVLVQRYNEAFLVAYTPHNEPFGLVPLEAMACAKPVVGVNEGGVKETVVHKYTGLLVERNPAEFGAAIKQLIENPALATKYGRNGREHVVKNWTWERAISKLTTHLEECASMTN